MYDIIKNVIESKDYELRDMLYKINKMYIESYITEDQKSELDKLARANANAENSYAPIQEQIDKAFSEISELKTTMEANAIGMSALKEAVEKLGAKIETPVEEPKEEYPEYVQPTGAHDCYNTGSKVTFKGEKYTCLIDGCVWSPEEYPQGWKKEEVTDEDTAEPTEDNSESEG